MDLVIMGFTIRSSHWITYQIHLDSIEALAQAQFNMRNVIVAQRTLLIPDLSPEERRGQYANIETARKLYREGFEKFESLPRSTEIDSFVERI